jgi:hypothetical protein
MKRRSGPVEQAENEKSTSISSPAQHLFDLGHAVQAVDVLAGDGKQLGSSRPVRPQGSVDPEICGVDSSQGLRVVRAFHDRASCCAARAAGDSGRS